MDRVHRLGQTRNVEVRQLGVIFLQKSCFAVQAFLTPGLAPKKCID
jgi:hypothetical protein